MTSWHGMTCGLAAMTAILAGGADRAFAIEETFGERAPVIEKSIERLPLLTGVNEVPGAQASDVVLGAFDVTPYQLEDAATDSIAGVPYRYGVVRDLPVAMSTSTHGTWSVGPQGEQLWTLVIEAPGALGFRVHVSAIDLPDAGRLVVSGDNGTKTYEGRGPIRNGEFWASVSQGDTVTLQYQAPLGTKAMPTIEVDSVLHIYRDPFADPNGPVMGGLLPCHEDPNCFGANEIARDSVFTYDFVVGGGGSVCTGALLADADPNTYAGYLLTANHCVSTQGVANSMDMYFFYHTNGCGGGVPSIFSVPSLSGATLLETSSNSDFSFMRTNADPSDGQGFAGWTTATPNGTIYSIHHPGGSWKRYSEGMRTTQSPICGALPTSRYWYCDWTEGMTEGGSSGGPMFNSSWQVVGQLFGACFIQEPGCNNPAQWNAVYGRFNYSHLVGGLGDYLNVVQDEDEYEDNDTFETAVPIPNGTHNMHLVDLDDYFVFDFPTAGSLYLLAAFNTADMDLDFTLRRADFSVVALSWGNSNTELIDVEVEAGTYILRVEKDNGWGGPYIFTVDAQFDAVPCEGDVSGDMTVGFDDLLSVLSSWGPCPGCDADLDDDDTVGFSDVLIVLSAWGPCP